MEWRVPPPVPDLSTRDQSGKWHYHTPETLPLEYKNNAQMQEFCPRVQLKQLIQDAGTPQIETVVTKPGVVQVIDTNSTWDKIQTNLTNFIDDVAGYDLKNVVEKEAENLYIRSIKKVKGKSESEKSILESTAGFTSQAKKNTLKMTIKKYKLPCPLPWNTWHDQKELTNTCTIDNMLFFFHVLQRERNDINDMFKNSPDQKLNFLHKIHCLFQQENWAAGKYAWISSFMNIACNTECVDLLGGEDQFFFDHLPVNHTTFKSTCDNPSCVQKVSLLISKEIGLEPQSHSVKSFKTSLNNWFDNVRQRECRKDGCNGVRNNSPRHFVNQNIFFFMELSLSPWPPTDSVVINGVKYLLYAVTYGNGHHFISCLRIRGNWYHYDGLSEYHEPGKGLVFC